jgi:hypothetical protein
VKARLKERLSYELREGVEVPATTYGGAAALAASCEGLASTHIPKRSDRIHELLLSGHALHSYAGMASTP